MKSSVLWDVMPWSPIGWRSWGYMPWYRHRDRWENLISNNFIFTTLCLLWDEGFTVHVIFSISLYPAPEIYSSIALQSFCWTFATFQFLNLYTADRTPWTGDQPVARPLPTQRTQTQNKRTRISIPWVGFEPTIPAFEDSSCLGPSGHCDRQKQK
jgi:hypothetical protein